MTPSALVVHGDERQLRFACDALVMFNPGYRVSAAKDLDAAGEWLEAHEPDLVVLDAAIAQPEALLKWATRHDLNPTRTILFGRADPPLDGIASATIAQPVKLPDLMATVRRVAASASAHAPQPAGLPSEKGGAR